MLCMERRSRMSRAKNNDREMPDDLHLHRANRILRTNAATRPTRYTGVADRQDEKREGEPHFGIFVVGKRRPIAIRSWRLVGQVQIAGTPFRWDVRPR